MRRFLILLKNEGRLSLRDMNMPIFALGMPLVILVVLGMLYGRAEAEPGAPYTFLEQSFGAVCAVSMCAGGLMGLPMVVSDYRERKILKRFRVTPMSPALLLAVEVAMYMLYCAASLALCAVAAVCFWDVRLPGHPAAFLGAWLLTMVSTLSIGMLVGGVAKDSRQAGVIASVLYFPMLVFSGTTVPLEVMPEAMRAFVRLLPLTQGIELMKRTFLGLQADALLPVTVMLAVTAVCAGLSIRFFRWE